MKRAEGDGRVRLHAKHWLPGTTPLSATRAAVRAMVERFDSTGKSTHSRIGGTLWVILEHCADEYIPYVLHVHPGIGYTLELQEAACK